MLVVIRRARGEVSTVDPADIRRLPTCIGSSTRSEFVGSWLILGSGIPFCWYLHGPHYAAGERSHL